MFVFREYDYYSRRLHGHGYHINKNTIEGFINYNKTNLITEYGEKLLSSIKNGEAVSDPSKLVFFLVLTFAVS